MAQKLIFFSSGEGQLFESTAKILITKGFDVIGLVTQNPKAGCVARAHALGLPTFEIEADKGEYQDSLVKTLKQTRPDFIILAGFTRMIPEKVVQEYKGRILNSHPSLLPKYGGKGMYGSYVHQAVIAAGEKETGISVHIVTELYDDGPVIAQRRIPVNEGESAEELEARLKSIEREFFGEALAKFLDPET